MASDGNNWDAGVESLLERFFLLIIIETEIFCFFLPSCDVF